MEGVRGGEKGVDKVGEGGQKVQPPVVKQVSPGDGRFSMETIVNNTVQYI